MSKKTSAANTEEMETSLSALAATLAQLTIVIESLAASQTGTTVPQVVNPTSSGSTTAVVVHPAPKYGVYPSGATASVLVPENPVGFILFLQSVYNF